MRHINGKTFGVLAMVAILLVGAVGGGLAADPSVDSETTDTSSESELTDGYEHDDFNASDDVNLSTLQASYDSTDPGIQIIDPESGEVIKEFTNESNEDYFENTGDDGAGTEYYNTTFTEADFAAMPMDAEENKSVTLRLLNNSTMGDDADTTDITIYLNNTDERAVVYAGDVAADEDDTSTTTELEVESQEKYYGLGDEVEQASVEHDNVGVSDDTTVYVLYANDSATDSFAAAEDRGWYGSFSSEDFIPFHQVTLEDTNHAVFLSDAPTDDLPDDFTYAETTTVDGHDGYAITLGETYEDESTIDVTTRANDRYGRLAAWQLEYNAFGFGGFVPLLN